MTGNEKGLLVKAFKHIGLGLAELQEHVSIVLPATLSAPAPIIFIAIKATRTAWGTVKLKRRTCRGDTN